MFESENRAGAAMETSAALLFGAPALPASAAEEAKVHCMGVDSRMSTSACKTAHNACKGQNSCKGQGFLELTQAQCYAAKAEAAGKEPGWAPRKVRDVGGAAGTLVRQLGFGLGLRPEHYEDVISGTPGID